LPDPRNTEGLGGFNGRFPPLGRQSAILRLVQEPLDTDVTIVGAGVVGCAIARELTQFDLRVTLLEAGPDVGAGTSKANTALLHTGFDAKPCTLEARLVARGFELLSDYAGRVGIPVERTGALLVAWDDEQLREFPGIVESAVANGHRALVEVGVEELYRREPQLGPGARGALEVPDETLICPFTTPLAYATEALLAGCQLRLSTPVTGVERLDSGGFRLATPAGAVSTRYLVNAAGLRSDELDRMLGHDRFTVTPRRGELIVFDKLARPLVRHIVLAVPTKVTKGVLIAPTVFGNVMLGPTAQDVERKDDTESTAEGLAYLRAEGARIMPRLLEQEVTAVYAGLRAATEHVDYQLSVHAPEGYACVGGIRSTGLSASMAIAEHVREELGAAGLRLEPRPGAPREFAMPNIGERSERPYQRGELIEADGDFGRIVCFCERVTHGEIRDALHGPLPATDLDGLRRRTRAHMGRCQGFFCGAELAELLAAGAG
jgi:glycerol-3-phosphate dehydrogenase